MKKLMRKLVLSCFALGLAVVTLTTTTFAWYTSNTDVTAKGITGTTASSGDPLLMIADSSVWATPTTTPWAAKVDNVTETKSDELVPLQRVGAEFHNLAGTIENSGWLEFTLYFKNASTEDAELYISTLKITNNDTENLPAKDVLAAGKELGMNDTGSTTYTINVLRTLLIETETTVITDSSNTVTKLWNPETLWGTDIYNDSFQVGWNAVAYYNGVMDGDDLDPAHEPHDPTDLKTSGTAVSLATVPGAGTTDTASHYVKVTFRIFINGWDIACFDACQAQDIEVELAFTTNSDDAVIFE